MYIACVCVYTEKFLFQTYWQLLNLKKIMKFKWVLYLLSYLTHAIFLPKFRKFKNCETKESFSLFDKRWWTFQYILSKLAFKGEFWCTTSLKMLSIESNRLKFKVQCTYKEIENSFQFLIYFMHDFQLHTFTYKKCCKYLCFLLVKNGEAESYYKKMEYNFHNL